MITFNRIGSMGRLGNQMFQYAVLYSVAKTRGYEFGIPLGLKTGNEYFHNFLTDAFKNISAKDSSSADIMYHYKENDFCYNAGIFGVYDNTDIFGYFQSEQYFKDYRRDILKEFTFKDEIQEQAESIRNITKNKAISIHIRLGDYETLQDKHPVCTIEYYQEALSKLPEDAFIYIFSDNTAKAADLFKFLNRPFLFPETNNHFVDMCLMSLCDYHIIANSSFSWWGAWLSDSKKIIAPKIWFGPKMSQDWFDIYCKGWIVI